MSLIAMNARQLPVEGEPPAARAAGWVVAVEARRS